MADRPALWRTWSLTMWLAGQAYSLGLIRGATYRQAGGVPMHLANVTPFWRTSEHTTRRTPPYVLGWSRDKWRCLLRYRHWPYWPEGHPVVAGMCGKCVPWPCCGSIEQSHTASCQQAPARQKAAT